MGLSLALSGIPAPSYLWLIDVLAVGEGSIDVEHAQLAMRYYECGVELPVPDFRA